CRGDPRVQPNGGDRGANDGQPPQVRLPRLPRVVHRGPVGDGPDDVCLLGGWDVRPGEPHRADHRRWGDLGPGRVAEAARNSATPPGGMAVPVGTYRERGEEPPAWGRVGAGSITRKATWHYG